MVENTSDPSRFPKEAMSIPSSTFAHPFALRHLAGAALLACALAAQAQPAPAEVRAYDLPAQPLGSTLARIAAEGGQQLSIDADLVRALTAPAVRGRFTPEQAARAALAGSGLELVRTEGGNWGLRRLPAGANSSGAAQASSSASSLAEVRVTAQADRSGTTEGTGSYQATATSKTHLSGTWPGPWTARNPALVLVGLNAQYQISPETQVNLVVSNLTDRTYRHLRSLNSSSFGEPRKFTVTLKHRF